MLRFFLVLSFGLIIVLPGFGQGIVSQWVFPSGFSTTSPLPSTGSGTASLIGGTTGSSAGGLVNGGSTENITGSVAWNTTTYPALSSASGTAGVRFAIDTTGLANLIARFDMRHSNTSSRFVRFEYTTDGTIFNPLTVFTANLGGDTWYNNRTVDLSGLSVASTNFAFRIVTIFDPGVGTSYTATADGSTYSTTGTLRFDMVTLTAGHVWTGGTGTSIDTAANYAGGTAPTPTSTLLLGTAGGSNVNLSVPTGGTTLAQIVMRQNSPTYTVSGTDALTLAAGIVNDSTNTLNINAPVNLGFANIGQSNALQNNGVINFNNDFTFINFVTLQGGRTNINAQALGSTNTITTGNPTEATIRVASGSTLGGTGRVARIVNVSAISATEFGTITAGTLADPTLEIGTTATTNNLVLGANAVYAVKIFGTGLTQISTLEVTGNVIINNLARMTLDLGDVAPDDLRPLGSRTYTVITGTGTTVNNFNTANLSFAVPNGFDPSEFAIVASPATGTVQLAFTPIPEPTLLLSGLLVTAFLNRRRVRGLLIG